MKNKNNKTYSKEEIIKIRFSKFRKFFSFIRSVLLAIPIFVLVFFSLLTCLNFSEENDETNLEIINEYSQSNFDDNSFIIRAFFETWSESMEDMDNSKITINIILITCNYFLTILITDKLYMIGKEIEETGKPFTKTNIKYVKDFSTLSIFLLVLGLIGSILNLQIGIGLMSAILFNALVYIFKYGYELQIESDETL